MLQKIVCVFFKLFHPEKWQKKIRTVDFLPILFLEGLSIRKNLNSDGELTSSGIVAYISGSKWGK
jgi:hypothetical protein